MLRIVWIVLIDSSCMTVESVQTFIGAKPHEALMVLEDRVDWNFRETSPAREILKMQVGYLGVTDYTYAKEQNRTRDPRKRKSFHSLNQSNLDKVKPSLTLNIRSAYCDL